MLAVASVDTNYHDTYFVVGHFHMVLAIAVVSLMPPLWMEFAHAYMTMMPRYEVQQDPAVRPDRGAQCTSWVPKRVTRVSTITETSMVMLDQAHAGPHHRLKVVLHGVVCEWS